MNIVLVGFKNSGKSLVGFSLSKLLFKKFIDVDNVIKKLFEDKYKQKKTIFEIFDFLKEEEFRKLEFLAFESLKDVKNAVIATSGGCILNNDNLKVLKNEKVVIYLKVLKEVLKNRVKNQKTIFSSTDFFEKEYEKRKQLYEKEADLIIETNNCSVEEIVLKIKENLYVK